jgi:general secretion pathway protein D
VTEAPPAPAGTEVVPVPVPAADGAAPEEPPAPPGSVSFNFNGPTGTKVGRVFTLKLMAQSDEPVGSLPLKVGFDGTVFQVVKVTEGDFLNQGGAQSSFTSEIDPRGEIAISGSSSGATSGVVASITFRTLAHADNPVIQLLSATPVAASGRAIEAKADVKTTMHVAN